MLVAMCLLCLTVLFEITFWILEKWRYWE